MTGWHPLLKKTEYGASTYKSIFKCPEIQIFLYIFLFLIYKLQINVDSMLNRQKFIVEQLEATTYHHQKAPKKFSNKQSI